MPSPTSPDARFHCIRPDPISRHEGSFRAHGACVGAICPRSPGRGGAACFQGAAVTGAPPGIAPNCVIPGAAGRPVAPGGRAAQGAAVIGSPVVGLAAHGAAVPACGGSR